MEKYLNFKVIINQDEDGFFVASCPTIPGFHTQGKTYEEAEKNIKEAIELCLKVAQEDDEYRKTINPQSLLRAIIEDIKITPQQFERLI